MTGVSVPNPNKVRYGDGEPLFIDPELCKVCGQPDNCGDCDHTPLTDDEKARLK